MKSNLSYKTKDDEIVIKRDDGKTLSFPNAKRAWHSGDDIVVVTALDSKTRVNKSLCKVC